MLLLSTYITYICKIYSIYYMSICLQQETCRMSFIFEKSIFSFTAICLTLFCFLLNDPYQCNLICINFLPGPFSMCVVAVFGKNTIYTGRQCKTVLFVTGSSFFGIFFKGGGILSENYIQRRNDCISLLIFSNLALHTLHKIFFF